MNWDDIRVLDYIERRGTLSGAARDLGVSVSTVSRRLERLESDAGALLVERSSEGCRVTPDGAKLATIARDFASRIALNHPASETNVGEVVLGSGSGFVPFMAPVMALYHQNHPGCTVRYELNAGIQDIASGELDVALRTIHLAEASLIYRRLPPIAFGVYASASYLARWPELPTPAQTHVVELTAPLDQSAHVLAARRAGFVRSVLRVSDFAAQLECVRQGLGVGVIPHALAGELRAVCPEVILPSLELYLVTRPQALAQPHIRAFVDLMYVHLDELQGVSSAP